LGDWIKSKPPPGGLLRQQWRTDFFGKAFSEEKLTIRTFHEVEYEHSSFWKAKKETD